MEAHLPKWTGDTMKQHMVQCRYWEEMYNICEPKGAPRCSEYLKKAKWCFGPLIIPLEWEKFRICKDRLKPDQPLFHCNGPGEMANDSYKRFWRNLYELRDYEDGPCNFYYIQRRKCFTRYHPDSKFCQEVAESFRQCVDITTCPMQYTAVRQCHEEHGVDSKECTEQTRYYNQCLYAVEFANDLDTAGLGMALARAEVAKDLETYRKDQEKGITLERQLVGADIANGGIILSDIAMKARSGRATIIAGFSIWVQFTWSDAGDTTVHLAHL